MKNNAYAPPPFRAKRTSRHEPATPRPFTPYKKKAFGQHFLRKQSTVDNMIAAVTIDPSTSVLEIGCGDGFLTRSILAQTNCKALVCYEIDKEWAAVVSGEIKDPRLNIILQNVLDVNFSTLAQQVPWVMLANLPYNITFPIIFLIQQNKHLFREGVIMIQDEVARKIIASSGKTYNPTSLFLQHHFSFKIMEKVEPGAFVPPPKVNSRLLYFKPILETTAIPRENEFWKFVRFCFKSPRQTIKNNMKTTHYYKNSAITSDILALRAQQMSFADFLALWHEVIKTLPPEKVSAPSVDIAQGPLEAE
jgi:16S rRNA (adenine1518-N6/adenine1519-N6)-dimethyltransferase